MWAGRWLSSPHREMKALSQAWQASSPVCRRLVAAVCRRWISLMWYTLFFSSSFMLVFSLVCLTSINEIYYTRFPLSL